MLDLTPHPSAAIQIMAPYSCSATGPHSILSHQFCYFWILPLPIAQNKSLIYKKQQRLQLPTQDYTNSTVLWNSTTGWDHATAKKETHSSMHIKSCPLVQQKKPHFRLSIERSGHQTKLSHQEWPQIQCAYNVRNLKPWNTFYIHVQTIHPRYGCSLDLLSP